MCYGTALRHPRSGTNLSPWKGGWTFTARHCVIGSTTIARRTWEVIRIGTGLEYSSLPLGSFGDGVVTVLLVSMLESLLTHMLSSSTGCLRSERLLTIIVGRMTLPPKGSSLLDGKPYLLTGSN